MPILALEKKTQIQYWKIGHYIYNQNIQGIIILGSKKILHLTAAVPLGGRNLLKPEVSYNS